MRNIRDAQEALEILRMIQVFIEKTDELIKFRAEIDAKIEVEKKRWEDKANAN